MYSKFRSWFTNKTCFAIYMSSSRKSNLTITVIFNSASIHPNHIRTSHFLLLVEHCQCSDNIILSNSHKSFFCTNDQFRCRVSLNKSLVILQLSPSDCFCLLLVHVLRIFYDAETNLQYCSSVCTSCLKQYFN